MRGLRQGYARPEKAKVRFGDREKRSSAAKFDHIKIDGTLLKQKLTPQLLDGDEGIKNFTHLVRWYLAKGTITSSSTL